MDCFKGNEHIRGFPPRTRHISRRKILSSDSVGCDLGSVFPASSSIFRFLGSEGFVEGVVSVRLLGVWVGEAFGDETDFGGVGFGTFVGFVLFEPGLSIVSKISSKIFMAS